MRLKSGQLEKQARCPHTSMSKEVIAGQKTGDTICNECGETFMPGEKTVPPEFRHSMIVSTHALTVALRLNKNLVLAKDVVSHSLTFDWALIDRISSEMIIPVADDVAKTCIKGDYASL